jgi:hypothetical protein
LSDAIAPNWMVHHADAKSLASILAWCNHVAPGDALLLEHDLVAPVVDRDAGEAVTPRVAPMMPQMMEPVGLCGVGTFAPAMKPTIASIRNISMRWYRRAAQQLIQYVAKLFSIATRELQAGKAQIGCSDDLHCAITKTVPVNFRLRV